MFITLFMPLTFALFYYVVKITDTQLLFFFVYSSTLLHINVFLQMVFFSSVLLNFLFIYSNVFYILYLDPIHFPAHLHPPSTPVPLPIKQKLRGKKEKYLRSLFMEVTV